MPEIQRRRQVKPPGFSSPAIIKQGIGVLLETMVFCSEGNGRGYCNDCRRESVKIFPTDSLDWVTGPPGPREIVSRGHEVGEE
jgi:hypothetical protein